MVVSRRTFTPQERLSKEDIRLLLDATIHAADCKNCVIVATGTRLELLIGKLKRMEKK